MNMIHGCSCSYTSSHCQSSRNWRHEFRVCSSNKLPNRPPNPRAFVGFKKQPVPNQVRDFQKGTGYGVRFEPSPSSSSQRLSRSSNARRYGSALSTILRALNCDTDFEKVLNSVCQNLSPKEQSVVLKEQKRWEKVVRAFEFFKSEDCYVPNVIHYNIVIRALGRARQWDELRRFWNDMAEKGVMPTNDTYGTLVDVFGKAGRFKESLKWVSHMKHFGMFPDEVTMNTVLKVMKDAGEYERGDRFYKGWCVGEIDLDVFELESMDFSMDYLNSLPPRFKQPFSPDLISPFRENPVSGVNSLSDAKGQIRKPCRTSTYNSLIDLYGKAGWVKDAAAVFDEMLNAGVAMDTITFNTMIFTFGNHGNLAEAEALLVKMADHGISSDTKTYNIMLSLYADVGNIEAASRCYQKIREVGLFPDVVTYRTFLHVLCERKMIPEAEAVIEDMKRSSYCIDEHSIPGMVKMYVREGMLTEAARIFRECESICKLTSRTRAAIMDAYAGNGLWSEAESIFYQDEGMVGQRDVSEYNVMVKAYGMAKLYNKAFCLFKEMRTQGISPDACTFNSLIQMFAGGDMVDRARDLLKEMKQEGLTPQCVTFSSLIASYARLGNLSGAVRVYEEMINIGVKPNEIVFGALINGYAETGESEEALKYFYMMGEWGVPVNQVVLTSLVKVYSKLGFLNEARTVYQILTKFEGGPDVVASNSMIRFYAELGMVGEAEALFLNLKKKQSADGFSYATMMHLYKKMGMLTEAIHVAEELKQNGLLSDVISYNSIMSCYVTDGQLHECGQLLHEMIAKGLVPDSRTLKILFTLLKKGGVPIEAIMQLESCFKEGKGGAEEAVFATVFSVVGMHDLALKIMETLVNGAALHDSFVFNAAINVYGQCGEVNRALNIFLKMQDEGIEPDLVSLAFLVHCYGKAGMVEGVRRIYWHIKDDKIQASNFLISAIIDAFKVANRPDLAHLVIQEIGSLTHLTALKESVMEYED